MSSLSESKEKVVFEYVSKNNILELQKILENDKFDINKLYGSGYIINHINSEETFIFLVKEHSFNPAIRDENKCLRFFHLIECIDIDKIEWILGSHCTIRFYEPDITAFIKHLLQLTVNEKNKKILLANINYFLDLYVKVTTKKYTLSNSHPDNDINELLKKRTL